MGRSRSREELRFLVLVRYFVLLLNYANTVSVSYRYLVMIVRKYKTSLPVAVLELVTAFSSGRSQVAYPIYVHRYALLVIGR